MKRLLLTLTVCCAVAVLRAAPAPVDDAPKLLIVSNRSGNPEIYLVNPDGEKAKNLTNSKGINSYPAWSPDRRKIAFVSDRDGTLHVYVMDDDGGNVKQLTKGAQMCRVPSWSPDGKKIVCTRRTPTNGSEICIMDADGGNLKAIPKVDGWDPSWSPDGKQILFTSLQGGGGFRVFVMDVDGSNVTKVSANGNVVGFVYPSWSPDGKHITWGERVGNDLEIYVADPDGKNAKQLTKLGGTNAYPAWSADGKKIAFHHSDEKGAGGYYVMDADGGNVKEWLKDEVQIEGGRPAWRPK